MIKMIARVTIIPYTRLLFLSNYQVSRVIIILFMRNEALKVKYFQGHITRSGRVNMHTRLHVTPKFLLALLIIMLNSWQRVTSKITCASEKAGCHFQTWKVCIMFSFLSPFLPTLLPSFFLSSQNRILFNFFFFGF